MAIAKSGLIKALNIDLAKEYAAAVQYVQHVGVITGAMYQTIKKELALHANQELGHALILADQINYLGGTPTLEVGPVCTAEAIPALLQMDLDGENDAIRRYSVRIEQAEQLKLFHLAQQLRTILAMEQEHAMDLQEALGK